MLYLEETISHVPCQTVLMRNAAQLAKHPSIGFEAKTQEDGLYGAIRCTKADGGSYVFTEW